jgi:hypothetical protein
LNGNNLYIAGSSEGDRRFQPRVVAIKTPASICVIFGKNDYSTRWPNIKI